MGFLSNLFGKSNEGGSSSSPKVAKLEAQLEQRPKDTRLLLDLAGVPKAEIVHNYAISAHYLEGQPKDSAMNAQIMALIKQNPEIGRKMAGMSGTAPDNMEQFLAALHSQYGGAEGYLKSIGVSEQEIQQLKVRLGQAG